MEASNGDVLSRARARRGLTCARLDDVEAKVLPRLRIAGGDDAVRGASVGDRPDGAVGEDLSFGRRYAIAQEAIAHTGPIVLIEAANAIVAVEPRLSARRAFDVAIKRAAQAVFAAHDD